MPEMSLPMEGSCRCGKVRIRVTAKPMMTAACHCVGCQKMAASAYSLTAMFPVAAFEVIDGEPVVGADLCTSLTALRHPETIATIAPRARAITVNCEVDASNPLLVHVRLSERSLNPWRHFEMAEVIYVVSKSAFMDIWVWIVVPLGSIFA